MPITTLFIDLDDTVYPSSVGLWGAIRERMDMYLEERMGFAHDQVPAIRHHLFTTYGTTLRGLQAVYHVDENDFLEYVHDLPIPEYLQPNAELLSVLEGISLPKYIFTNSDIKHATRVLNRLGISECFMAIIDIHSIAPFCKPMSEAYQIALSIAGNPSPDACLFVDDSPANLEGAQSVGMQTLCVNGHLQSPDTCLCIHRLEELPAALTRLEAL